MVFWTPKPYPAPVNIRVVRSTSRGLCRGPGGKGRTSALGFRVGAGGRAVRQGARSAAAGPLWPISAIGRPVEEQLDPGSSVTAWPRKIWTSGRGIFRR